MHKSGKSPFLNDLRKNKTLYLMIAPTVIAFFLFCYVPMIGIYYAFTNFNFHGGLFGSPFIGMGNFAFLWKSGQLLTMTRNTVLYNVLFVLSGNFSQILIAILLSEITGKTFKKVTQALMFLPWFVSFVLVGTFMYAILRYETGALNGILVSLGKDRIDAYSTPAIWPAILFFVNMWKWLGYGSVIYLASIMGIGVEYYEAADIDGANAFAKIRHITLPLLKPTLIIMLLLSLGTIMRGQFDLFYQVAGMNGMIADATIIIDTFVFNSLKNGNAGTIGMGTAAGLYQSLFGFILIMTTNFIIRKTSEEHALF